MAKSASRKRSTSRRASSRSGSTRPLWPWLAALIGVGGAIYAHDSGVKIPFAGTTRSVEHSRTVTAGVPAPAPRKTPAPVPAPSMAALPAIKPSVPPLAIPVALPAPAEPAVYDPLEGRGYSGKFFLCGNNRKNDCIVDGNTFWHKNARIRLVDVEIPRINKPGCERERNLASDAERRLWELLDAAPFDLATWPNHDRDQSGTRLRVVMQGGRSVGDVLVREGLARKKGAPQKPWC